MAFAEGMNCVGEGFPADDGAEVELWRAVEDLRNAAFQVGGPALVQPTTTCEQFDKINPTGSSDSQVLPARTPHKVTTPA